MMLKANRVAHDDKLYEEKRKEYSEYEPQSREYISNLDQWHGFIFLNAAIIRHDKAFYKKHGRTQSVFEFLFNLTV